MVAISGDTILVPLASEQDASDTCASLRASLEPKGTIVVTHTVKRSPGAPDALSPSQATERGERIFQIAQQELVSAGWQVDPMLESGTDIGSSIHEQAIEVDADLIAFTTREDSRIARLLTGDTLLTLVTDPPCPVLALPTTTDEDES